jgi:hypothetical protein
MGNAITLRVDQFFGKGSVDTIGKADGEAVFIRANQLETTEVEKTKIYRAGLGKTG